MSMFHLHSTIGGLERKKQIVPYGKIPASLFFWKVSRSTQREIFQKYILEKNQPFHPLWFQ